MVSFFVLEIQLTLVTLKLSKIVYKNQLMTHRVNFIIGVSVNE